MSRPASSKPPTLRQEEWLGSIRDLYSRTGPAPTPRELMVAMGTKSTKGARHILILLARREPLREVRKAGCHTRFVPLAGSPPEEPGPTAVRAAARLRRTSADLRKLADELGGLATVLSY